MNLLLLSFALILVAILGVATWGKLQRQAEKGLVLIILIITSSIYILALTPHLGTIGDNAHYIILAKSLLQGQFSRINHPDNPPETVYGFGFPLLLTPLAYFFPDNYGMWKTIPLFFGLFSLLLAFSLFRSWAGIQAGLVIMALMAVNPYLLTYSQQILTEAPYLFFSLLTLILVKKCAARPSWMNFSILGTILAMLMTYFTRTIGLSLFLAALIFLCLGRQFKKAGAISLPFLFFALLWYFLKGVDIVLRKIPGRWQLPHGAKSLKFIVLSLVLLFNLRGSLRIIVKRDDPYPPQWANYFAVARWAKDNTPLDSLIMGRKPYLLYLFSERKTVVYPFTADTAKIISFIEKKRVNYVLLDAFTWTPTTRTYLYPAVKENWQRFSPVISTEEPKTYLLKVKMNES